LPEIARITRRAENAEEMGERLMANQTEALPSAFDGHCVDEVKAALEAGADAWSPIRGKLPVEWLTEQYWRTDNLAGCLRLLLEAGAVMPDPAVTAVLLDDPDAVSVALRADPTLLTHRTTMASAFTSLAGVSLLHVAAEFGNQNAARALIASGSRTRSR
jgi:hypothetical protein